MDTFETAAATSASPATIPGSNVWSTGNVTNANSNGWTGNDAFPQVYRYFSWNLENDYRYDNMLVFLQRGWAARFLNAARFYDFYSEYGEAHSDGFQWYQHWNTTNIEVGWI